jgi:hypothetical protein
MTENEELNHSDDLTIGDVLKTMSPEQQKVVSDLVDAVATGKVDDKLKQRVDTLLNQLDENQQNAVYAIVGMANEETENEEEGEKKIMHNVFENENENETLVHSEIIADAIKDAKRYGSLKDSFIEHAAANNIENINMLFPEAKELNTPPHMIEEDDSWVSQVMAKVGKTPFSKVRTTFGRMNEETARAKGYIKGNKKVDSTLTLLNRSTTPQTVYEKMTMDRDDVIDITSFDVVVWIKQLMRKELNKGIAGAILIGDGRQSSDAQKINEINVRPILTDDDLYTIKKNVTSGVDFDPNKESDSEYKGVIRAAKRARKAYKGSGNPTFYTTESVLAELLLIEDRNGRIIYDSEEKLATALRVKDIVTVPEMERLTDVYGIIVNLADYNLGADKGGSVGFFDDFDIDYNQQKYLIETRVSGAMIKPYGAIVLKKAGQTSEPEQDEEQNDIQG